MIKIHQKLFVNKIQANIFISPYFTTLFTNTYSFHPDNANKFLYLFFIGCEYDKGLNSIMG